MIRVFTGWDAREAVGWGVFAHSVLACTTQPMALIPLTGHQFDGSNAFTYSRFMVPALCDYTGWAIFLDGADMMVRADLAELWALRDEQYAVQVVQHDYQTKDGVKYRGSEMECRNVDYRCKNWSSVMLINCGHPKAQRHVTTWNLAQHQFCWLEPADIGALPMEWNWLADEYGDNPNAKIVHWTRGIPALAAYRDTPMAAYWFGEYLRSQQGLQPVKGESKCQVP